MRIVIGEGKQQGKMNREIKKLSAADLAVISMFAALLGICSWISVPAAVPFTMQTFGVFLAVTVLGGRRGTMAVLLYLLMGVIGLPVFSGFGGGLGYLLGSTGGYIMGFVPLALGMWGMEGLLGRRKWVTVTSMVLGLFLCYTFGTIWFMMIYMGEGRRMELWRVLTWCVVPYILPDILKMLLALAVRKRLMQVLQAVF